MTGEITPRTTTTVVVEERRRRKAPILWIAGGAACLLAAGSTFALWQDTAVFTGGTITAGNLDLVTDQTPSFYDVSTISGDPNPANAGTSSASGLITDASLLRADESTTIPNTTGLGHAIDPSSWRITPGDTVAAVYDADVTLKGDNLVADLNITDAITSTAAAGDAGATQNGASGSTGATNAEQVSDSQTAGPAVANNGGFVDHSASGDLIYGYALYQDGALLASGLVPVDGTIATFATDASSQAGGGLTDVDSPTVVPVAAGGTSHVTVVITVTFNKAVEARQDVTAASSLQGITLTLLQDRSAGLQNQ